jgi:hypothetical protein
MEEVDVVIRNEDFYDESSIEVQLNRLMTALGIPCIEYDPDPGASGVVLSKIVGRAKWAMEKITKLNEDLCSMRGMKEEAEARLVEVRSQLRKLQGSGVFSAATPPETDQLGQLLSALGMPSLEYDSTPGAVNNVFERIIAKAEHFRARSDLIDTFELKRDFAERRVVEMRAEVEKLKSDLASTKGMKEAAEERVVVWKKEADSQCGRVQELRRAIIACLPPRGGVVYADEEIRESLRGWSFIGPGDRENLKNELAAVKKDRAESLTSLEKRMVSLYDQVNEKDEKIKALLKLQNVVTDIALAAMEEVCRG